MPVADDIYERCDCGCCEKALAAHARILDAASDAALASEGYTISPTKTHADHFVAETNEVEDMTAKLIKAMADGGDVPAAMTALNFVVAQSVKNLAEKKKEYYKKVKLSKASIKLAKLNKHRVNLKNMLLKKISPAHIDHLMAIISKNDEEAFLDDSE